MKNRTSNIIAALLLLLMLVVAFFSLRGDALTFDESAHIPAGYSYLTEQDMRLNPEHPPLIKDIAALPLIFQDLNIPTDSSAWQEDVNGQWSFGHNFIFESGNNPETIILSSRVMMLIFLVLVGIYIFIWAKEKFGNNIALFALLLFSFSPTFLAHGRYVTTDVGAVFGFLFALYYFIKYFEKPSKKYLVLAGLSFGIAQLIKFSLILIIPLYIGLLFIFWIASNKRNWKLAFSYIKSLVAILVIGFLLVWPVYQFHTLNYPVEKQLSDTQAILDTGNAPFENITLWMADKPILRPYAQYALGLSMVFLRTSGGNTTYFMGQVSAEAWKAYFPIMFLLKVPIPALIFMLIALLTGLVAMFKRWKIKKLFSWIDSHKSETAWIAMIAMYWLLSIVGNLNIGIRHVLPTFVFIYFLTAWGTKQWLSVDIQKKAFRSLIVFTLLIWYIAESVLTFPFYLAYFNEFAGGPDGGHRYAVDSNLDWGQDLKRLAIYVEENDIDKIKLAYFGGDSPELILGDKYEPLNASIPGQKGWLAISATLLEGGRAEPAKGFNQSTTHHEWLNAYEPTAKIGYSIFIYHIE